MTDLTITVESGPSAAAEDIIRGLVAWNLMMIGARERELFTIAVRDEHAKVLGGITAMVSYEVLYIGDLWIEEDLRGKRLGSRLMAMAEEEGRKRGATLVWLDTMSWQARPFYEKLGYTVFGELPQSRGRYWRFFMQKPL